MLNTSLRTGRAAARISAHLFLLVVAVSPVIAQPEVERSLIEALDRAAAANAVVLLASPADGVSIAEMQDAVLSGLPEGAFTVRYRYRHVAALAGSITGSGVDALRHDPYVTRIGLDEQVHATLQESVPLIGAPVVHATGFTGRGVTVVVLDSGIDTDHPDLQDNVAAGAWHFLGAGTSTGAGAEDDNNHGTMVSGTITGKGIVAAGGVAPESDIWAIKVLDRYGSGWMSDFVAGLDHVLTYRGNYANLAAVNMSLGTNASYTACGCDSVNASVQALARAINAVRSAGIAVFVAAGNGAGLSAMPAPGCITSAVSVGATYDAAFSLVAWSSCTDVNVSVDSVCCYTDRMQGCLDLLAPGAALVLPTVGGGVSAPTGGTSFACPHVAGAAALLREAIPGLTPLEIESALHNHGVPISVPGLTGTVPRIDVGQALSGAFPRVEAQAAFRIGTRVPLKLKGVSGAGRNYAAAASLATRPATPLGGGKSIALALDDLMIASFVLPAVFESFQGVLNGSAEATAYVNVPADANLVGLTIYVGFVVYQSAVDEVSWPLGLTVTG